MATLFVAFAVVAVVDVVVAAAAVVDVEVVEPEWTCATWTMAVAEVMVAVGRTGSSRATAGEVGLGTLASYRASCSAVHFNNLDLSVTH